MMIAFPFENIGGEHEDPDYLLPEEAVQLRTRLQAENALKSSHEITERFWNIWSQQYLTSLWEAHKMEVSKKRAGNQTPKRNAVVLASDPVLPRNSWKIGRIVDLKDHHGTIREATLRMPNGKSIRRPIHYLIPLELEEDNDGCDIDGDEEISNSNEAAPRYNLRPRNTSKEPQEHRPAGV
ncbi:unnamed protein product [Heligmosomoides polygyrus]|uniref:DUF5641 domain-containing protein n=1 Tax=Heligmosomoides polygyrus TaxID=6339 RepID=A0A183GU00_HELPZ|nr:unnamed protein product [Heligmosomoides polygyrus]